MKAPIAALAVWPWLVLGQATAADSRAADSIGAHEEKPVEEILVFGKNLSAEAASIDVVSEPVLDAAESLARLPGADANVNGRISGIAQYRGLYGDRVAVTIDGIGMISGGPNAMDAPLSYLSPMITEELLLERGIPGVGSAPEGIGGHIDARLARGSFGAQEAFGPSGMAGMRYSANGNTRSYAGRATYANQRHRMSLLAEVDRSDGIEIPAGRISPSVVARDRFDASYAYAGAVGEALLFAGGLMTEDTGTPALEMDIRSIDTAILGAQFSRRLAATLRIDIKAGFNDVTHRMDNFTLRPAASVSAFRQNDTSGRGGVFEAAAAMERGAAEYTFGLNGRWARHESLISNPEIPAFAIANFNALHRDLLAVFAIASWSDNRADWEFGLRYNDVGMQTGVVGAQGMMGMMAERALELAEDFNAADRSRSFASVDGVLKYRRQMNNGLRLAVDMASKSRAPAYQEMYLWLPLPATGGLADGRSYIGNLDLAAERMEEIVLGVQWSGKRFDLSPQIFLRRVSNYIQGVPATNMTANMLAGMMSGMGALQFENVDARIVGADIGWHFTVADGLRLDGTAAYVRGRRTDAGDNLYRLPPPNASLGVSVLRQLYSVRLELVGFAAQDRVSAYNAETPSPGYALVNALWVWHPGEQLQIEVQATNVLNREVQPHLVGINRAAGSDVAVGERLYGAERGLMLGAIVRF